MDKLFNYSGNKNKFVPLIKSIIGEEKFDLYFEPFMGSGSIFYNLPPPQAKSWYVADVDENIIKMHKSLMDFDYDSYVVLNKAIDRKFGDIKTDKEAYYAFRNAWNQSEIKSGMALVILASCCLNSMLRFGPNGMNQSFGKRRFFIEEESFNRMKAKVKSAIVKCESYNFDVVKDKKVLLFIDPPYLRKMTYDHQFDHQKFIDSLIGLKLKEGSLIILTYDGYKEELLKNGFEQIHNTEIVSTSPNRDSGNSVKGMESVYIKRF